jgi:hypothetical protein
MGIDPYLPYITIDKKKYNTVITTTEELTFLDVSLLEVDRGGKYSLTGPMQCRGNIFRL